MDEKRVLAIDVGGTAAKFGLVNAAGEISDRGSFRTATLSEFTAFVAELSQVIATAQAAGVTKVGIACPGVFDGMGQCVGSVENLPFLSGRDIPSALKDRFPNLQVSIENDGTAAAMGEYHFGAAKGSPCFICITLGTGIGSALVIDGKPHLGHHFRSGEVGYFNYQSPENYYEKKYSTKGILRKLAAKLGVTHASGRAFTQQVEQGEPQSTAVFDEWMDAIGRLIANMMLLVDPERVVIGGGISREKALLLPALTNSVNAHLPPSFQDDFTLKMAQCGNDAGLLGAAAAFF